MSTTTTKTRRTASTLGLALPASVVGAAGIAAVPALADTTRYDEAAFDTIVPSNFVILDSGNAFVLLDNGTAIVLRPDQFSINADGNLIVLDTAAMAEIAHASGDTAMPNAEPNQLDPGIAAHGDNPLIDPYLGTINHSGGHHNAINASHPAALEAASLRMQAQLSETLNAAEKTTGASTGTAAAAPAAAIPGALLAAIALSGSSDESSDPGDPGDPDDPGDPGILPPPPAGPQSLSGFVINGVDASDESGTSVSSGGDVNGDGYDDVIIGAARGDPNGVTDAGESYVVFGKADGYTASLDLSSLDGSNGFVINGVDPDDLSGISVSSAGDVNKDDYDDLIIGAWFANQDGEIYAGESYVVFGKAGGYTAGLDLSSLDGSNGFVINGIDAGDLSGYSVSSAGDINNDGYDDVIIGAMTANPGGRNMAGESYVVFGKAGGYTASLDLSDLDGSNGFVINGVNAEDTSGRSVSSAGDINNDGYDDVIIGATQADQAGNDNAGESYVVFGKADGYTASLDLSSLDGSNGFVINGIETGDISGFSVSSAGDVNNDTYDDLIIGARDADANGNSNAGESYVVFGKANGYTASLNLSSLDGSNGFVINGIDADDGSGYSVSSAGDLNNDSFDDIIVGAPEANGKAGESYVIFGMETFNAVVELDALPGLA